MRQMKILLPNVLIFLVLAFIAAFLLSLAVFAGGYLLHLILPFGIFQASVLFFAAIFVGLVGIGLMTISDNIEKKTLGYGCADCEYMEDEDVDENEILETEDSMLRKEYADSFRKHARNQPCHCGSGKKYKRCCLKQESESGSEDMPF